MPVHDSKFRVQQDAAFLGGDDSERSDDAWFLQIEQYEVVLEEMAAATMDKDFKDELSAIEQWFRVLSEAERTASIYALMQQLTGPQLRFIGQVISQMVRSLVVAGHAPASPETTRKTSPTTTAPTPSMDLDTMNAMFPDAVAAIAEQRIRLLVESDPHEAAVTEQGSLGGGTGQRKHNETPSTIAEAESLNLEQKATSAFAVQPSSDVQTNAADNEDSANSGLRPPPNAVRSSIIHPPMVLPIDQEVPTWLRQQRLHKFTDNLKDLNLEELMQIDDKTLLSRGVTALGARRKMLKNLREWEQIVGTSTLELAPPDVAATNDVMPSQSSRSGNQGKAASVAEIDSPEAHTRTLSISAKSSGKEDTIADHTSNSGSPKTLATKTKASVLPSGKRTEEDKIAKLLSEAGFL